MPSEQELISQWIKSNPQQFAGLKNTIKRAEGSDYNVMFGGGRFNDYTRHPDKVVRSGGYASAAAGIGQFMPGTWAGAKKALNLPDFSPASQDQALAYLAHKRLMPIGGLAALTKQGMSPEVQARLAPEWASFPTMGGSSYYGQPVKKQTDIQKFYQEGMGQASAPTAQTPSESSPGFKIDAQTLLKAFAGNLLATTPSINTQMMALLREQSPIERDVFEANLLTPVSPYLTNLTGR
jgi:muramidase (phage lysozyme)